MIKCDNKGTVTVKGSTIEIKTQLMTLIMSIIDKGVFTKEDLLHDIERYIGSNRADSVLRVATSLKEHLDMLKNLKD